MDNIGNGAPSKRQNVFDEMDIKHPANKHGEWAEEKQNNREAKKRAGPRIQRMVKSQLEIVEVGKDSLFPHICSLNFGPTVEFIRLT